jgi:hypothetical protein
VNLPGRGRTFGEGMDMDRKPAGRLDPRLVQRALESMRDDAPADLAISEDQADEIKGIMDDFRAEMRAFRAEHAEELARLRAVAGNGGPQGGPGGPPPEGERAGPPRGIGGGADGGGMPPEGAPPRKGPRGDRGPRPEPGPDQKAARQQLRELMGKGPKTEDLQARVWGALRPEQRDLLNGRIEEMRREVNAREAGMEPGRPGRGERREPEGGPGLGGPERRGDAAGPERRGGPGERMREGDRNPERRERVMERLQKRLDRMSPEERDRVMQRIERWLDGEGERGGGEGRPPRERRPERRDDDRPPA